MSEVPVLYYSPGACSLAVHIAIEEAGSPFETRRVAIAAGAHRLPEFLAINPRGRVPAMRIEGRVVTEVQALLELVADLSLQSSMPVEPVDRARVRELLAFQSGTVHVAFAQVWRPERFTIDTALHPALVEAGRERLPGLFDEIEATAADGFMVGDGFSLADLLPFVFYRWARRIGTDVGRYHAWTDHAGRLIERPAVRRALATEGLNAAEWLGGTA